MIILKINRKQKIIIAVLATAILVIGSIVIIKKISSTEKVEKTSNHKKESTKDVDKKKTDNKDNPLKKEEITKIEEENKEKTSSGNNSSVSSNSEKKSTESPPNNSVKNNTSTNSTTNSVPQQQPQNPPSQTEWEKLGISQYAYYHTPMIAGEEVAIDGDMSLCTAEINRLIETYHKEGLSGGNSYTVNGKYTYSYIGCGINVFINGVKYKYSQIKAMGYK